MASVYVLVALSAAALAAMLTPLVARVATALGLVDAPGGRKIHERPVPRLGGLAVIAAAALAMIPGPALATLARAGSARPDVDWTTLQPIAAGSLVVFGLGVIDDVRGVGPAMKLGVQTAAAVVAMASGLLIERVTLLGATWALGWLAWPVTWAWLVGLTNAFNLIDGLDGLAAGVAGLAGAACAAILAARGHAAEAVLLAALSGAALGFLVHNFAPASIFLGDGGSLVCGFVLAATAIAGWQKGATTLAAGVPLLIFALPIADAGSAVVRRIGSAGRSSIGGAIRRVFEPDRAHIHDRLLALGWSTRQAVLFLYTVTAVLSLIALATARVDAP